MKLWVSVGLNGGLVAERIDVPGAMAPVKHTGETLEDLIDGVQGGEGVRMEEHFHSRELAMSAVGTHGDPHLANVPF